MLAQDLPVLRSSALSTTPLPERIADRSASICIVGLGYVGLTVACAAAEAGFSVVGIDIDETKIHAVSQGVYPLRGEEPGLPRILANQVHAGRLRATGDFDACSAADLVLIVVQTPVDDVTKAPALGALRDACTSVGAHLSSGVLVIVESTLPPGAMRRIVVPALEQASGLSAETDFFVGCCPERVMPGKLLANLRECSRVFGGWTVAAAQMGAAFYRALTHGDVDATDCLTAELVKTTENAYRDVQIAFANEVALLCEDYGADVYAVRKLVNKSPYRDMHLPGAGVGGHCIPKDPWLLIAHASSQAAARLVPAARAVNDFMPRHMADLAEQTLAERGRQLASARIAVLGYAYLENSDDARNSPSAELVACLRQAGAHVVVHDPFVPGCETDLAAAAAGADCLVLMVAHDAYREIDLQRIGDSMRDRALVDGRHLIERARAVAAGFTYRCLGVAC